MLKIEYFWNLFRKERVKSVFRSIIFKVRKVPPVIDLVSIIKKRRRFGYDKTPFSKGRKHIHKIISRSVGRRYIKKGMG